MLALRECGSSHTGEHGDGELDTGVSMTSADSVRFLPGAVGERALLVRLKAGEESAFSELYGTHAPRLLRLLIRVLKSREMAEDSLQETFQKAFNSVHTFRGEAPIGAWLSRIALRGALNQKRSLRRGPEADALQADWVSLEPALLARSEARRLLKLLEQVTPVQRLALLLTAEGHTAAEIAFITGEPRSTVLARIARTRALLLELAQAPAELARATGKLP